MVKLEDKVESFSHIHTKETTKASTTKPENDLKTVEQTIVPGEEEETTQRRVK